MSKVNSLQQLSTGTWPDQVLILVIYNLTDIGLVSFFGACLSAAYMTPHVMPLRKST